jgi:hypothetical protein
VWTICRVARTRAPWWRADAAVLLLPVGTWLATLALDLPPNVEAAMILVAAAPAAR